MKVKTVQFLLTFLMFATLLMGCSGQSPTPTATLTATIAPTSTETSTPEPTLTLTPTPTTEPTLTPTPTITATPTETAIPMPASLTGTIFLSGENKKPFASSIELRQKGSFELISKSETDAAGVFRMDDIDPGSYELWVLITSKPTMISGCSDVAPPDNTWKMGIKFTENQALTMDNAYLSKALLLSEGLGSSDLKAQVFFAVLSDFKIESGIINTFDVILICE
jgi:hypothetical protein